MGGGTKYEDYSDERISHDCGQNQPDYQSEGVRQHQRMRVGIALELNSPWSGLPGSTRTFSAPSGTRIPHNKSGKLTAMRMTKTGDCGNATSSRNAAAKCPMNTRSHRPDSISYRVRPHTTLPRFKSKALWAWSQGCRAIYPSSSVASFHLREDPEQMDGS